MRIVSYCRKLCVVMATCGVLVPVPHLAFAGEQHPERSSDTRNRIQDVELGAGNTLAGVVIGVDGAGVSRAEVSLRRGETLIQKVETDQRGEFRFDAVRGGVYQLAIGDTSVALRAWTRHAAPPHARESVVVISGGNVVRGQRPLSELFVQDPFLFGIIIAAAIAIPIAVHNSKSAS